MLRISSAAHLNRRKLEQTFTVHEKNGEELDVDKDDHDVDIVVKTSFKSPHPVCSASLSFGTTYFWFFSFHSSSHRALCSVKLLLLTLHTQKKEKVPLKKYPAVRFYWSLRIISTLNCSTDVR